MDGGRRFFTGARTGGAYDKTIIDQIMLKYRPIAPKPIAGGSLSGEPTSQDRKPAVTGARSKRKYVRIRKRRCKREKVVVKPKDDKREKVLEKTVVTLQLLPENGKSETRAPSRRSWCDLDLTVPIWLTFNDPSKINSLSSDRAAMPHVMESLVTVECVTDAYADGGGLGGTDAERMRNLELDACPGFVSDGWNRVRWVNAAYRRMMRVPQDAGESPPVVAVELVVKEELPAASPAFACRVRLEYRWQNQKSTRTVPCDVWRIDLVGLALAWRLDMSSALSLGR